MPTCPSCHRDQVRSSAFCAYCGAVLDRPVTASEQPEKAEGDPAPESAGNPGVVPERQYRAVRAQSPPPAHHHDIGDVGGYIVRRLFALLVDIVLVGGVLGLSVRAWVIKAAPGGMVGFGGLAQIAIAVAALWFSYRWLFEGFAGTTLGKLVVGLSVSRSAGGSAGLVRAFVRTLFLPLDLALIGFLVAAVTPQRRRIGDFAAGTIVANAQIGALAPVIGVVLLAAVTYAGVSYAGGIGELQRIGSEATKFAPLQPVLPTPASTPAPTQAPTSTPSPSPTPAPTSTPPVRV